MRSATLLIAAAVVLSTVVSPIAAREVVALPDPAVIPDMVNRVAELRTSRGLPPLTLNAQLTAAAQDQANWLVETGIRAHRRPEDGSRAVHRAEAAGYQYEGWCCGENYYMSIDATPDMVWNFWVWSPPHYTNLTLPRFTEIGVGMATDGYRHSYVLVFGRPLGTDAAVEAERQAEVQRLIDEGGGVHIVTRGETLARIANRYGASVGELVAANNLPDPNLIMPGTRLVIPQFGGGGDLAAPAESPPPVEPVEQQPPAQPEPVMVAQAASPGGDIPEGARTHTVQSGENLFRIALNYGTDFDTLAALNNIENPRRIFSGQVIVLP